MVELLLTVFPHLLCKVIKEKENDDLCWLIESPELGIKYEEEISVEGEEEGRSSFIYLSIH